MDSFVGSVVAGRYRVLRLLGRGGMGRVYEVELTALKKRYALKVLARELAGQKDALLRFRREAEIVASLNHPNIIEIIDWTTLDDGRPTYVMELLEGMDLEDRIKEQGALPFSEIAIISAQCVSALSEAHAKGILHRDLKPTNVFITERASTLQVKLIDFGLAKARDLASITLYTSPKLIGTPAYMSPAQLEGKSVLGAETDCWSLAAVLYEAATAKRAFKGVYAELYYQIGKRRPVPVSVLRSDAPPAFVDAIAAALSPDENRRITSLEELGDRVAHALLGEGPGVASLQSMARASTRDADRPGGLPDTLPWGTMAEDAELATQMSKQAAAARRKAAAKKAAAEIESPAKDTLPWGASSPDDRVAEASQTAPIAVRSTQRVTKPARVAEQPSARVSRDSAPPIAKAQASATSPVPASPIHSRPGPRSTDAPHPTAAGKRSYGVLLTALAFLVPIALLLLSTLGDDEKASTKERQRKDSRAQQAEARSDASTELAAALGVLVLSPNPTQAEVQVRSVESGTLVFSDAAPNRVRLPAGKYRVLTSKSGYVPSATIVEVVSAESLVHKPVLVPRTTQATEEKPRSSDKPALEPTSAKKTNKVGDQFMPPSF